MLIAAVLVAFGTTACKKSYTCTCTYSGNGVSGSVSATSPSKMKKADAEKWCDDQSSSAGGVTTTCESKKA